MREQYQVPKSQVQQIRDAVDIVEVISEHLPLKKAGSNYKGLCPFHREKTPSFMVSAPKQIYHCFGCGVGGNVFDFLMRVQNIGFKEALQMMADKAGIELISYRSSRAKDERDKFYRINQLAVEFFQKKLDTASGKKAKEYLKKRSITQKEISEFKLGLAPMGWSELAGFLKSKSVDAGDAVKAGLIIEKKKKGEYYDRFRARLMFPIFNRDGKPIAFGGRTLSGEDAKYINSSESPVFYKRASFYGLDSNSIKRIGQDKSVIVVEGYMDLIALRQYGFGNSVATLGTAFTVNHARVLKRFTDSVFITFDSDEAGLNAVKRVLRPVLLNGLEAKVIILPKPYDPDSFLRKFSAKKFTQLMDGAENLLDFYIKKYYAKEVSLVGQAKVLGELRGILGEMTNEFIRELYTKKISELTGMKYEVLSGEERLPSNFGLGTKRQESRYPKQELLLIRLMFEDHTLLKRVKEEGILDYFSSDELKNLAENNTRGNGGGKTAVQDLIDEATDEGLKNSLAAVFVREGVFDGEATKKAFENCVARVRSIYIKRKSMELQKALMDAERQGDELRCREILEEKKTLINGKYSRH